MPTRLHYSDMIDKLQRSVVEMGALVVKALRESVRALIERDVDAAQEIVKKDEKINQLENEVVILATELIAEEQPVATDLRMILSSLRASHTLERIADNAVHISKSTILLVREGYLTPLKDLPRMASISIGMVEDALDVFVNPDVERAREISNRDVSVDKIYKDIFRSLLDKMHEDPDKIDQCMSLLFVCRRLERVADHATHICEDSVYIETGDHIDLNL